MKTLVLMRHGDAADASSDFERPLNRRGSGQCLRAAQEFIEAGYEFELILCSGAARALASAHIVSNHCAYKGIVDERRSLYLAQPEQYLEAVRQTPSTVNSLLLVAHNPGLSILAGQLRQTRVALGTGDYAVLQLETPDWRRLGA